MRATIGPVHRKMYGRILYQDAMAQALLHEAAQSGWATGLTGRLSTEAPAAAKRPLEEVVNPDDIHGWLSHAVAACERRFSAVVCGILREQPGRMGALKAVLRGMGKAFELPVIADAVHAYQAVHAILLDGMPCDFPFDFVQQGPQSVLWQVSTCPHAPYWMQGEDCGVEIYYRLRDAWIEGALERSNVKHSRPALYLHALRKENEA